MPNWCSNGVEISHDDPFKIKALADAMMEGKFLNHVIPVPADLTETMAGSYGDDEKQKALEAKEQANLEKYGAKNWYDFCVARWGTKWDVDCNGVEVSEDGKTVTASFESAWSPPTGVYEELVDLGFQVVGYYYEPGMAYVGKYDNGIDECLEYGGENSKTVRDAIGEELDDYFNISEDMAMWEDENEEA